MDTAAALAHRLTEDERRQFADEGWLIVRNALVPDEVVRLTALVDCVWEEKVRNGHNPAENFFLPNFAGTDPAFAALVDHPSIIAKVAGILGWNIYLYHSHLGVTPQEGPESEQVKPLGFHQDSGRVNVELEGEPRPRLSLKVAFWLSDVSVANRGNFWIVPGKHVMNRIDIPEGGIPEGAVPALANPGDAVFFDRRLWHSRSANHSAVVRKALFYGYAYRWLRTKDDMTVRPDIFAASDPIRRQLLGDGLNANGRFSPTDADVPLKAWVEEHLKG